MIRTLVFVVLFIWTFRLDYARLHVISQYSDFIAVVYDKAKCVPNKDIRGTLSVNGRSSPIKIEEKERSLIAFVVKKR